MYAKTLPHKFDSIIIIRAILPELLAMIAWGFEINWRQNFVLGRRFSAGIVYWDEMWVLNKSKYYYVSVREICLP